MVKTIKDRSEIDRLHDEKIALLKITSKNVVQIYDIINFNNESFGIVMEHIDGHDLTNPKDFIKSSHDLLMTLWQISSGISDIHDLDLIHRDIKPNNIMKNSEGIIKILDFGLTREFGENAMTFGFKGTLGFAAPEQYKKMESLVNFTSAIDVYSFGVTSLYFIAQTIPKITKENLTYQLPDNSFDVEYLMEYPSIIALLERCFNEEPKLRPKITEIRDEIKKYLLYDKHNALLTFNGQTHLLDNKNKKAVLSIPNIGSCKIKYDGLNYIITKPIGEIYLNNTHVTSRMIIPGSCVIGIGALSRPYAQRQFITFDISNPEIIL